MKKEVIDAYMTHWNGLDARMYLDQQELQGLMDVQPSILGVSAAPSNVIGTAKCRHCGTDMKKRERAYLGSVHVYHGVDGEILVEKEPFQGPWQVMDTCDECCKPADSMEGHYLSKKLGTF